MQRHLISFGGELGPVADAPQMPAVAQTHQRDPGLRRFSDPDLAREFAHDLTEAPIAIDDRDRVAVEDDGRNLIGFDPAFAQHFFQQNHLANFVNQAIEQSDL